MATNLGALLKRAGPPLEREEQMGDQPGPLEDEMRRLVNATHQPNQFRRQKALTLEAQKLLPETMILAAKELVARATEASMKYLNEAQDQHDRVVKWGEKLLEQTELAAGEIAESHAGLLRSALHFKAAMDPPQKEEPNEESTG